LDPTPAVFSFGRTVTDINDDAFYQSPGLKRHARHVLHFLDRVMVLLLAMTTLPPPPSSSSSSSTTTTTTSTTLSGTFTTTTTTKKNSVVHVREVQEVLQSTLLELGQKHYALGVTARMYQPMGQALLSTVAELLQEYCHEKTLFTNDYVQAWITVYHALASDLITAGGTIPGTGH
jgi:hypothetical protein